MASEQSPTTKKRKGCLKKAFLLFVLAGGLFVVLAATWRVLAPTKNEWMLFPLYQNGLMAESLPFWLAGRTYGDRDVYAALQDATQKLREKHPGSKVAYMDVSSRGGGKLWPHNSHTNGVDVDIRFFSRGPAGGMGPWRPAVLSAGYPFNFGKSRQCLWLTFDAERTWTFICALHESREAKVEKIFVEDYIEKWLLEEGQRQGASQELLAWAQNVLRYAGDNAADHKDHMHIRFARAP